MMEKWKSKKLDAKDFSGACRILGAVTIDCRVQALRPFLLNTPGRTERERSLRDKRQRSPSTFVSSTKTESRPTRS